MKSKAKIKTKGKVAKTVPKFKLVQGLQKQRHVPAPPNTFRISNHDFKKIGHGLTAQLPRYRKAG